MNTHILVIDDDLELCELLRSYLGRNEIEVSILHDAESLGKNIEGKPPDLIVMGAMKHSVDRLTALRRLRVSGDNTPVIMLTGGADDIDRIGGLETGADDYIGKPFNPNDLLTRVKTLLLGRDTSRSESVLERHAQFVFGRFTLHFESRTLSSGSRSKIMTISEFELLKIFIVHSRQTLSRALLTELLFGASGEDINRNIDMRVWRLRQILEKNPGTPKLIQTVRGYGYVFVPEGERHGLPS
jgi:two-component system, OmpR family, phosphate regulon response regulator OmpR